MHWKRLLNLIRILLAIGLGLIRITPAPAQSVPQILQVQSPPPPPPTVVTATAVNPGPVTPQTLYYWVIARYASGSTAGPQPAVATGTIGAANLTGTNYVRIDWTSMPGATGYDVLRSTSPVYPAPTGSCTCAVVVNTAAITVNDQSPSLSAYTQPASAPAALGSIFLDGRTNSLPTYWTTINNAVYRLPPLITAGLSNDDCIKYSGGFLQSAGAACGSGGGTPGGVNGDIQYNNAGAFGGYAQVPSSAGGLSTNASGFTGLIKMTAGVASVAAISDVPWGCIPTLAGNVSTVATPCKGIYGGNIISPAGNGTLSGPGGTGTVYAYLKYNDLYFGLFTTTGTCNANATCESLSTNRYPQGVIPIARWTVTAGTLGSQIDDRGALNSVNGTVVNGDANIGVSRSANGDVSLTCPGCGGAATTTRTILETYWCMAGNNTRPIPWVNFSFTGQSETVVSALNWYGRCGLSEQISAATDNGFAGWRMNSSGFTNVSFTSMPVGGTTTIIHEMLSSSITTQDVFLRADGAADLGGGPADSPANTVGFRRLSGGNWLVQWCVASVCGTQDTGVALAASTNYRFTLAIPQTGNWTWTIESGNTYATVATGTAAGSKPTTDLLPVVLFRNDGAVQPTNTMFYYKHYITLP